MRVPVRVVLADVAASAASGLWQGGPVVALVVAVACLQAGIKAWRGGACDGGIAC